MSISHVTFAAKLAQLQRAGASRMQDATLSLAKVGAQMSRAGHQAAQAATSSHAVAQGTRIARVAVANFPTKELATMCGRAGVAGAVVDGANGGYQAYRAVRQGRIDARQAVLHAGAEAGCGFVTSSAGTAGTLAAYMITGTMGPLAIAAGMGASVGSRHLYRMVVGQTLPETPAQAEANEEREEAEDESATSSVFDKIGPKPQK